MKWLIGGCAALIGGIVWKAKGWKQALADAGAFALLAFGSLRKSWTALLSAIGMGFLLAWKFFGRSEKKPTDPILQGTAMMLLAAPGGFVVAVLALVFWLACVILEADDVHS